MRYIYIYPYGGEIRTLNPVPNASELMAPNDDLSGLDLLVKLLGPGACIERHLGARGAVSIARGDDVGALHLSNVAEGSQELAIGAPGRQVLQEQGRVLALVNIRRPIALHGRVPFVGEGDPVALLGLLFRLLEIAVVLGLSLALAFAVGIVIKLSVAALS